MIRVETITDKTIWDSIAANSSPSTILQSWDWGEFQLAYGRKIWRLGVYDNDTLVGVALTQLIPTRLRTHLYVSNGPVIERSKIKTYLPQLLGYLKALAIQEKVHFVRIDPMYTEDEQTLSELKVMGLKVSKTFTQSENKWLLDVTATEEELLMNMRKSTRYEVKRAEKEGVKVYWSDKKEDYDKFEKLFLITAKRQDFIPHPLEYYRKQFEVLSKGGVFRAYVAQKDGQTLATALISFYGDTASYLHAASLSNSEVNKYNAPPALVWQAIKDTKSMGMKYFDFWGIALTDDPKHPWAGFTRFKKGFGGFLHKVIRAHDIPISSRYALIAILDATREVWGIWYYKLLKLFKK
ncbi:peptidoglycan bridge formation glycyltransferase FemA/FemB family protein [Candidatus Dojkabacteria bacterium]|nr:peptidoglycan bridge formation glycyltransferase FemA/FemB family protein [Candidatus Dojkabacteria bacterium]